MTDSALTAFVSHSDTSRHDTGWRHADHQGRMPALVRAVYKDMLTLHGHLLDVEAAPATEAELLRVHAPGYLDELRAAVARAAAAGEPVPFGGTLVSDASWDAAVAAAGTAIRGVDAVLGGEAANAFAAARPAGGGAWAEGTSGFSLLNSVAIALRHAQVAHGVRRVLVVEWSAERLEGTRRVLAGNADVRLLSVHQAGPSAIPLDAENVTNVALPLGAAGELYRGAFESALGEVLSSFTPELVLLSAGFDALATDPLGSLALTPLDYYLLTRHLVERAEACCSGRLVSVLEGGYDPAGTGRAVVQHLRALTGLPAA
jgi:acetoin utilization deacetylase AcuC-like enzyme